MANLIPQSPPALTWTGILDQWSAMKEDKSATLYFPFGDEYAKTFTMLRNGVGQLQEIHQPRWSWFERDRMEVPFTVDNGPVPRVSGAWTVDIPSNEVDALTGYSWPWETSLWQHLPTGNNYYIQDKPDGNTLVLRAVNSSVNTTLADGDKFMYVGQTSKERSDGPDPQYYFSTEYTVGTQNVRHAKLCSGNALYNQMWTTQTEAGVATPYSNSLDILDLQRLHNVTFVQQFFANQKSNNLTSEQSFNSLSSTEGLYDGLLETVQSRGQVEDTGGSPDEQDFFALQAKLSSQDASIVNYQVLMSGTVFGQISTSMLEYLKQTNLTGMTTAQMEQVIYGESQLATNGLNTTLDFQALTFGGKNFALTRMGLFDNPQTFNAMTNTAANPWQSYAFFIPAGQGANDGLGNMGKYCRILHKPNRFMNMAETGFMARSNRTRVDELAIDILSEYTIAFIAANNFGLFYNSNI